MVIKNIVVIDGREVEIEDLTDTERRKLSDNLNKKAILQMNYVLIEETA